MAKFDIDLYKELEVSSDATREEIRLKYYTLSRRYHPDFNQNTPNATEKAKRLNLAWDILGDNAKRVEYDLEWSRKTGNRNSHEAYSEAKKREQEEQKTKRREEELRRSEAKKHEQEKQKINRREEELRRAEEVKQRGKTRRQGWNEGESYLDAQTRLEMIWIPKGIFSMGCDYLLKNEKPVRRVNLDGFWMSRNVVTVGQYEKFCVATNRAMPIVTPDFNPGWSKKDHPIVIVSWKDAKAYCDWAYLDLPTEAEWEYACRGGLAFKEYPWGNEFDRSKLRCSEIFAGDSGGTSAVGAYPANGYGLHDMMGNVMQWCSDFYSAYAPKETDNPQGPTSGKRQRVVRGGSWHGYHQVGFRCAYRYKANPTDIATLFGFRCVYRGHR